MELFITSFVETKFVNFGIKKEKIGNCSTFLEMPTGGVDSNQGFIINEKYS